jgi:hypothetical protein
MADYQPQSSSFERLARIGSEVAQPDQSLNVRLRFDWGLQRRQEVRQGSEQAGFFPQVDFGFGRRR